MKINGKTSILHRGESAVVEANVWHDWWNETSRDVHVRLEVTPGLRFAHMIETFWGLARLGHTNRKGIPSLLQLAVSAREFSDTIVLRKPPLVVQRLIFGPLSWFAHCRGHRATYPQLSRIALAPRVPRI